MFSDEQAYHLDENLFYLTKLHNYAPSEIMNMTYLDYKMVVALLLKYLREEEERYKQMKTGM